MDDPRQHLGIARICESHGGQILIFPRRVVRLFGLQAGDEVGLRKRRGQSGYCVTFWRAGKRPSPLYNYPQLPPARPTKRGREGLLASDEDLQEATYHCANGLLSRRQRTAAQLKAIGERLLTFAVAPLEAIGRSTQA